MYCHSVLFIKLIRKAIKFSLWVTVMICTSVVFAQEKKPLDETALYQWNSVKHISISDHGEIVTYQVEPNNGDSHVIIYNLLTSSEIKIPRATNPRIDDLSRKVICSVKPSKDLLDSLKTLDTKEENLPGDTLVIYDFQTSNSLKYSNLKKVYYPEKWEGFVFAQIEVPNDKLNKKEGARKNKKEEYTLISIDLNLQSVDTIEYVTQHSIARDSAFIALIQNTPDSTSFKNIYLKNLYGKTDRSIFSTFQNIKALSISNNGNGIAFISNDANVESSIGKYDLYYYQEGLENTTNISKTYQLSLDENWCIPEHTDIVIHEPNSTIYFGVAPKVTPIDSTIYLSDRPEVEIWHYQDQVLYTQQKVNRDKDRKQTFKYAFKLDSKEFIPIENQTIRKVEIHPDSNSFYSFGLDDIKYRKSLSWEGRTYKDLYIIDNNTGNQNLISEKISGSPKWSPAGKYIFWYEEVDTSWYLYDLNKKSNINLTKGDRIYCDELNDSPDYPNSYGYAGWLPNDEEFVLYDRYDIWLFNPAKNTKRKITNGRDTKTRHRILKLDEGQKYLSPQNTIIHGFNESDKSEFYALLDNFHSEIKKIYQGNFSVSSTPLKPKESGGLLFSKEDFSTFPDLLYTPDFSFSSIRKISNINPQQEDFIWGNIELVKWELNGNTQEGLLVKPENFDPSKKYPMIVNFYERSSDNLHTHRAPFPHRSTINYTYYTSNGYLVFNPDITYQIGYPGKSALDAVLSGTEAIIKRGFVDEDKIGLQGHSWGGYQIAHILTKTDMFACAEAGAPVVNMISAYGGIRWQTGLSRMFQYEHTQSRLGATLWQRPDLYLENSPIFELDKVNTPVLIMHNDNDGHVPWYQGIEFFVAMRRLSKPAWMLNYNGEPHWPLKWANRLDFNRRLFQFFEHYLKDAPAPTWMMEGVPEVEKGSNSGLQISDH